MKNRSGATLLEILVVAALLLLLLAVTLQVFVPALRAWTRVQHRSRLQQTVLSGARWIRTDLQEAAPRTVRVEEGLLVATLPGEPPEFDPTGLPLWTRQVVYWRSEEGNLHRQLVELPPEPEAHPAALPPLDPRSRVIARDLSNFQPEMVRPGMVRFNLTARRGNLHTSLTTTVASFHPVPPEPAK